MPISASIGPGSTATIATNGGQANSNVSFVAGARLYW